MNRSGRRNIRQRIRVVARNRVSQLGHFRIVIERPIGLIEIEQLGVEPEELVVSFGALIARFAGRKLKVLGRVAIGKTRFGRNVIYGSGCYCTPAKTTIGMADKETLLSSELFRILHRRQFLYLNPTVTSR
jgi:hypothetical protein